MTFVDSDDYVAPNYVSTMYNLLKKYETRISACGVRRICENEEVIESEYKNGKDELLDFDKLMPRFFKYEFWGFPGGLYHRSVFNDLMFPKATLSEDYNVKTQMFCNERQMAVTSTPLYFYEYHENIDKIMLQDQDVLNMLYHKSAYVLTNQIYNCLSNSPESFVTNDICERAHIIHYAGIMKPWSFRWQDDYSRYYWDVRRKETLNFGEILIMKVGLVWKILHGNDVLKFISIPHNWFMARISEIGLYKYKSS